MPILSLRPVKSKGGFVVQIEQMFSCRFRLQLGCHGLYRSKWLPLVSYLCLSEMDL